MKILIIAPHPDDEILGVGGTIAKHVENGDEVTACIVTKGFEPLFSEEFVEKSRKECREADRFLGIKETIFLDFPAVMLENVPRYERNNGLIKVIEDLCPDMVYIPHRGDMQLDHKLVVDAAMVALRPKYRHKVQRILSYETMSETGWDVPNAGNEFVPMVYSDISGYLEKKLKALEFFTTQIQEFPGSRSIEAVRALAVYRGSMMNMRAAEAFGMIRELV